MVYFSVFFGGWFSDVDDDDDYYVYILFAVVVINFFAIYVKSISGRKYVRDREF